MSQKKQSPSSKKTGTSSSTRKTGSRPEEKRKKPGRGVSALIFWYMTEQLGSILEGLEMIQDTLPLNAGYIRTLIKIVGITYIAEFASDLCKDAGYQAVAGQIQMFGKLSVLAVSIPILTALLDTVRTFLGG